MIADARIDIKFCDNTNTIHNAVLYAQYQANNTFISNGKRK